MNLKKILATDPINILYLIIGICYFLSGIYYAVGDQLQDTATYKEYKDTWYKIFLAIYFIIGIAYIIIIYFHMKEQARLDKTIRHFKNFSNKYSRLVD